MLNGIIHKIRNGIDDVGSFITGQPAHGPAPTPQPTPQPQQFSQGQPRIGAPTPVIQPAIQQQQFNQGPKPIAPSFTNPLANKFTSDLTAGQFKQPSLLPTPPQQPQAPHLPQQDAQTTGNFSHNQVAPQSFAHLNPNTQPGGFQTYQPTNKPVPESETPGGVIGGLAQGFTRVPVEIAATVANRPLTVPGQNTNVGRFILGNTPTKPIQQDVMGTYRANEQHGPVVAGLAAAGNLGLHVAQDVPVVGGIADAIKPVANAASEAIRTGAPQAVEALHGAIQSLPNPMRAAAVKTAAASKPVQSLPTNSLVPTDLSGYGELDPQRVDFYKQQIASGKQVDPILAMKGNDGKLYVEDGKHRLAASQQMGVQNVPTRIVTPEDIHNISQGGYASLPFLEPGEREISPLAQGYAAESSAGDIHQQAAESMYNFDKSVKGGNMQTDGEGGYIRTTQHTPFYSEFFKQNGKAPTKADYLDAAKGQLENGGGNLVDPEQADAYQLAKQRELSNANAGVPAELNNVSEGSVPINTATATPGASVGKPDVLPSHQNDSLPTSILPNAEQNVFDQNPMNPQGLSQPAAVQPNVYHGTQSNMTSINQLRAENGRMNGLFGPGIYLTDNPTIAEGYSKTRGVDAASGRVLSGRLSDNTKLFDLEQKLPSDVAGIFEKVAKRNADNPEAVPDFSTMKGVDAIREIKKYMPSIEDYDDFFTQELHPYLEDKGYTGFKHVGGIQGGEKHNVSILFGEDAYNGDTSKILTDTTNPALSPSSSKGEGPPQPAIGQAELSGTTPQPQSIPSPQGSTEYRESPQQLEAEKPPTEQASLTSPNNTSQPENVNGFGTRNAEAERVALGHLNSGGTRDEAVKLYQDMTGVGKKSAQFQVSRAARDAGQTINPNARAINPELKNFDDGMVSAGDYTTPQNRYHAVKQIADLYKSRTINALNKLAPEDRNSFYDYVQGVKDVGAAKDPQAVQGAIDTFRKGADTMHALDTQWGGGKTNYIKDFFPDYWADGQKNTDLMQHKAEQDLEEEIGPDEWRKLDPAERSQLLAEKQQNFSLDTGNYSGFRNQARTFANRAEGLSAGLEPRFTDPRQDVERYFTGAQMHIAPQTVIKGAREADMLQPKINRSIDLAEDKSFQTSKAGKKQLGYLNVSDQNRAFKVLRAADKTAATAINQVPIVHGLNQEGNAMFSAAWRMPGNKLANMAKIMANQARVSDKDIEDFYRQGNYSPKYGLGSNGFIARGLRNAGVNPDKINLGSRGMAKIEETVRVAIWKRGQELGMEPKAITEQINHALGSPKRAGNMESAVGIFMHYLHTNMEILKDAGVKGAHGNPSPIIGLATGYAAWQAGNKVFQEITGNKNASLHAPGVIGTLHQLTQAPGQIANGQIPSVISSHTNPAINAALDQIAGRNLYTGQQFTSGKDRVQDAVNTLFSPVASAGKVSDGKNTLTQQAVQDFGGASLPHVKGTAAAPNFEGGLGRMFNTPGATTNTNAVYTQVQQYYNNLSSLKSSLLSDNRAYNAAMSFIQKDKTPDGQTIELAPGESEANWKQLASNPKALLAVQKFYQNSTSHNPEWDLTGTGTINGQQVPQIALWAAYKSLDPGNVEKDVIAQENPWISQTENNVTQWAQSQNFSGNAVQNPGYVPYPNIPQDVQKSMTLSQQLAQIPAAQRTQDQINQLRTISNDPNVQAAYKQLDDYNNSVRAQMNLPKIQYAPDVPQAVQDFESKYMATNTAGRSALKTQYPSLYNQMQQAMEQSNYSSANKYGGEAYYGAAVPDTYLSDMYSLGKYDITKMANPNGTSTYALDNFTGSGQAPNGLPSVSGGAINSGSGGSNKNAAVARRLGKTAPKMVKNPYKFIKYKKPDVRHMSTGHKISNITAKGHYSSVSITKGNKIKNIKPSGAKQAKMV